MAGGDSTGADGSGSSKENSEDLHGDGWRVVDVNLGFEFCGGVEVEMRIVMLKLMMFDPGGHQSALYTGLHSAFG